MEAASGIRRGFGEVDGLASALTAVDPETFAGIVDVGVVEGDLDGLGATGIAVLDDEAAERGWSLGEEVPVRFAETGVQSLTVAAIYTENELAGTFLIGFPAYEANVADQFDLVVLVDAAEGVSASEARAAIEGVTDMYATAELQDQTEFKQSQAGQVDQMLNLVYVLLVLAIVIALIGIGNTLALSIFERTRELGLLRALGMTRAQLRATVRWESVIIALLGTTLGLAVGLFFGWAMVSALADEGISRLEIPLGQLAAVAVIAALGRRGRRGPACTPGRPPRRPRRHRRRIGERPHNRLARSGRPSGRTVRTFWR